MADHIYGRADDYWRSHLGKLSIGQPPVIVTDDLENGAGC